MKKQNQRWIAITLLMLVIALAACNSAPAKPTVTVSLASSGAITENQDVIVQVLANDNKGIARIELTADNTIVSVANLNPAQKSVSAPMTWKSSSGQHTLAARALNVDNVLSDPATVLLNVAPAPVPTVAPTVAPTAAPLPTAAPTQAPAPTAIPQPTAVPIPPTPVPCTNVMTFIADVTVPDGTAWAPNQGFNKIWRVRNDGSCVWNNTYQFAFAGGTQMSGARAIAVPNTNPGAMADLLVTMVAPASYGTFIGSWQMHAPNGVAVGPQLHVSIRVINPNPPPQPTAIPTQQPVTRRNVTGMWVSGEWSVDLTEAFGCAGTTCSLTGKLTHGIFPTPELYDLAGSINVYTGAISFGPTVPGGPTFSGTVSADSRTMSGTLSSVGHLTFGKQ